MPTVYKPKYLPEQQAQSTVLRKPSMPRPVRRPEGEIPINRGGMSLSERAQLPDAGKPAANKNPFMFKGGEGGADTPVYVSPLSRLTSNQGIF